MTEIFNNITGIYSNNRLEYLSLNGYYISTTFIIKEGRGYYQVQTKTVQKIPETLENTLIIKNFLNFTDLIEPPFERAIVTHSDRKNILYRKNALYLTFFGLLFSAYFYNVKPLKEILNNKIIKIYYTGTTDKGKYHNILVTNEKVQETVIPQIPVPEVLSQRDLYIKNAIYGTYNTNIINNVLEIREWTG